MNDDSLSGGRSREHYRRLIRERGPDTGREIGRLTYRGADGAAEALLAAYECGAIPVAATNELSVRGDDGGYTLFMVAVSTVGDADRVG